MIRKVTGQEATRRTWKGHGRPRYGFWFGYYQVNAEGIPVELGMDRGMVKATDRRDGSTVGRFGPASKVWLAPIPMPREGDELIYVAEGDFEEYRVRVVDTADEQYSLVTIYLVSDGMEFKVRAERLRYPLDELQEQAIAEDAQRFPAPPALDTVPDYSGDAVYVGSIVSCSPYGPVRVVAVGVQPRDHDYIDPYTYVEVRRLDGSTVQRWSRQVSIVGAQTLLDVQHAIALAEDAERSSWPLTVAVEEQSPLTGMWWGGRHHQVSTDLSAQQLAEQIGTALDMEGTHRVLVWTRGQSAPSGEHIATIPSHQITTRTLRTVAVTVATWNPDTSRWSDDLTTRDAQTVRTDRHSLDLAEQVAASLDLPGRHNVRIWDGVHVDASFIIDVTESGSQTVDHAATVEDENRSARDLVDRDLGDYRPHGTWELGYPVRTDRAKQLLPYIQQYTRAWLVMEHANGNTSIDLATVRATGRLLSVAERELTQILDWCGCPGATEVRMSECRHGCKVYRCGKHFREVTLHSSSYGCTLGR